MIYKEIPDYPGYFASDCGDIWSNHAKGICKNARFHKLKPGIQGTGKYFIVNLKTSTGIRKTCRVHRAICLAFHGEPPTIKHTASHIDGNWRNNKPDNLAWETYSENLNRKKEHGTDDTGVKNSRALIDEEELKQIRNLLNSKRFTHKSIGEKFGVNRLFITKIANGHRYKGQGI